MATANRLLVYDPETHTESENVDIAAAIAALKGPGVGWLTVYAPTPAVCEHLEQELGLHHLALEDAQNERQRPKVEDYDNHAYIVARTLLRDRDGHIHSRQINLFMGPGWVVVIRKQQAGLFEDVRDRIRRGRPQIRSSGAGYLTYALLDAVIDTYFPVMDAVGDEIEQLETQLVDAFDKSSLDRIHALRHELRVARKHILPAREAAAQLLRAEIDGFGPKVQPFLRDVHDHVVLGLDALDAHREAAAGLMDLYMTASANQTNDIMKVLTLVATIFIPITFVAGIYGMNFDTSASTWNMPELGWPYGYAAFWGVVLIIAATMIAMFRRRRWI